MLLHEQIRTINIERVSYALRNNRILCAHPRSLRVIRFMQIVGYEHVDRDGETLF